MIGATYRMGPASIKRINVYMGLTLQILRRVNAEPGSWFPRPGNQAGRVSLAGGAGFPAECDRVSKNRA